MENKKVLFFKNRYNDTICFTPIAKNQYKMTSIDKYGEKVDYGWRFGMKEDNKNIEFVDPPGGPFVSIGYKLRNNKTVISIESTKDGITLKTI